MNEYCPQCKKVVAVTIHTLYACVPYYRQDKVSEEIVCNKCNLTIRKEVKNGNCS